MELTRRHIEILGMLSPTEAMTVSRIGARLLDLKETSWPSVIRPYLIGLVSQKLARVVEGRPRLYYRTDAGSLQYLAERNVATEKPAPTKSTRAGLKIGAAVVAPVRAHPLVRQFRSARIAAGMTVAHVARKSGYAANAIHDLETGVGRPSVAKLADLCEVVGLRLCIVPADPERSA
jgi:hypothetical protein